MTGSPEDEPSAKLRIVARRSDDAEALFQVNIEITPDSAEIACLSDHPRLPEFTEIVRRSAEAAQMIEGVGSGSGETIAAAVRAALEADGYIVEAGPDDDLKFSFHYDPATGVTIGEQMSGNGFPSRDAALGRGLIRSVGSAFGRGATEVTNAIDGFVDAGDHQSAAEAALAARATAGYLGKPPRALLAAMMRVTDSELDPATRKGFLIVRTAVAEQVGDRQQAGRDAAMLLDGGMVDDPRERAILQNTVATAAIGRGERETAIAIWSERAATATDLDPADRGWVLRNLAYSLPAGDPLAIQYARQAMDAFLQAGRKEDLLTTAEVLTHILAHTDATAALGELEKALALIDGDDLRSRELKASVLQAHALNLVRMRNDRPAFEAVSAAAALRRGILGREDHLLGSLRLAAETARRLGETVQADAFADEARKLAADIGNFDDRLTATVLGLIERYDQAEAELALKNAHASGDERLITALVSTMAVRQPDLALSERLHRLETHLGELRGARAGPELIEVVRIAMSNVLREAGRHDRAIPILRELLEQNPLSLDARDSLLGSLIATKRWSEAATFLRREIERLGELPNLLFLLGRTLLEGGDANGAIGPLRHALREMAPDAPQRPAAQALIDRALDEGGLPTAPPPSAQPQAVTRADFEAALAAYADFVSGQKRMTFWRKGSGAREHAWIANPEAYAQNLLHTFLKARFGDRIDVFEELGTGAGRLDLYLSFEGGLAVIVELKMCGANYSSAYAASGEDQIRHYMDNRRSRLGYLVVHDARLEDFGAPLVGNSGSSETILHQFVDLRPRSPSRRGA